MKTEAVSIDSITIPDGRRPLVEATVVGLVESMAKPGIGQLQPIRIRRGDGTAVVLVAGRHRLEAAQRLGWPSIDAVFVTGSPDEIEMQEISENLHRAELTVLQRAEQVARWIELSEIRKEVSAQVVAKPHGGRPEGGVRAAARELGVGREGARRAISVAAIKPAAKEAACKAGLADNQSALLAVSKAATSRDQVSLVKSLAKAKARPRASKPQSPPAPARGSEAICDRVREAIRVLSGLPPAHEVQRYFAGTDAASLVTEAIGPARVWLDEFADGWLSAAEVAE